MHDAGSHYDHSFHDVSRFSSSSVSVLKNHFQAECKHSSTTWSKISTTITTVRTHCRVLINNIFSVQEVLVCQRIARDRHSRSVLLARSSCICKQQTFLQDLWRVLSSQFTRECSERGDKLKTSRRIGSRFLRWVPFLLLRARILEMVSGFSLMFASNEFILTEIVISARRGRVTEFITKRPYKRRLIVSDMNLLASAYLANHLLLQLIIWMHQTLMIGWLLIT